MVSKINISYLNVVGSAITNFSQRLVATGITTVSIIAKAVYVEVIEVKGEVIFVITTIEVTELIIFDFYVVFF